MVISLWGLGVVDHDNLCLVTAYHHHRCAAGQVERQGEAQSGSQYFKCDTYGAWLPTPLSCRFVIPAEAQPAIHIAAAGQFVGCAHIDDAALVHHDHAVGKCDRAGPVGDE